MKPPLSRPPDDEVELSESPCGFTTFVAEHRGIGVREAEQLIEYWLETYEPAKRQTHSFTMETDDDREPDSLRICA